MVSARAGGLASGASAVSESSVSHRFASVSGVLSWLLDRRPRRVREPKGRRRKA